MLKVNELFLSLVVLVSLDNATMVIKDSDGAITAPVVIGKPSTPTPEGVYLIEKAYSTQLKQNILVFKKDEDAVTAIHVNLKKRTPQLKSSDYRDNKLSNGCIGVSEDIFNKLWKHKQPIVLQVY